MLAKANRITRGADYRATVRRGARSTGASTVTYIRPTSDSDVVRFGGQQMGHVREHFVLERGVAGFAPEPIDSAME